MHYYQFNIGDYKSHTSHLDPIEDIAYRRLLDWCYLHEKPLPKGIDEIARLINMRSHCDSIASVLKEFFYREKGAGWFHCRVKKEIAWYAEKSEKARSSAKARWDKTSNHANALRTECESNANHKPITNNHKPYIGRDESQKKNGKFIPPTIEEVSDYLNEKGITNINAEKFVAHYEATDWTRSRGVKIKNWKACVTTWKSNNFDSGNKTEKYDWSKNL